MESGILLSALVAVSLNAFFNGVSAKTAEADAASAAASATH
jgi:NCS2 family nucleobase:cation symporter-2